MKVLPGLLRYRAFQRLIGSYLVLAVATIGLLSAILFSLFSASAAGEIAANSRALLGRTAYASDILDGQIRAIGGHLLNDVDVVSWLYSKQSDKIVDYNAMRSLDRITAVYTYIRSIGLYNRATGGYLNNVGMASRVPLGNEVALFAVMAPRVIPADASPDRRAHPVLTFMLYPYSTTGAPEKAAIEINIDERYLQSLIASIAGATPGTVTMVLDRGGTVLSHAEAGWFMRNVSSTSFAARILAAGRGSGSFIERMDGSARLVSYVTSERNGWSFVMTQPYDSLIGNIHRLRGITLLVAVGLAALGALLSALMSGVVYRPLGSIVERVGRSGLEKTPPRKALDEYALISETLSRYDETASELRRSLGASIPVLREAYVRGLMKGESSEGLIPEATLMEFQAAFAGSRFLVIALKMDSFSAFKRGLNPGDQGSARIRADRIASEELGRFHPCDAVIMEEDEIALLLRGEGEHANDTLVLALAELQRELRARVQLSFTVGVGDPAWSLPEVRGSYEAAVERCRYRLFFGPGRVIDEGTIRARLAVLPRYPAAVEGRIVESLKHGDADTIGRLVQEFIDEIAGLSYYQLINCTGRLLLAIFSRFGESTDLLDANYKDYDRLLKDIESSETLGELAGKVADFCARTAALIGFGSNRVHVKRNERIVEDVKRAVAERFAEPGLSLDIVAGLVELSPGYLAKLFKLVAGQSFGDYLNCFRLEKARELLSTTNHSALAIGESVGIYNATYFSTLFKKAYGLSPAHYRNRALAS